MENGEACNDWSTPNIIFEYRHKRHYCKTNKFLTSLKI